VVKVRLYVPLLRSGLCQPVPATLWAMLESSNFHVTESPAWMVTVLGVMARLRMSTIAPTAAGAPVVILALADVEEPPQPDTPSTTVSADADTAARSATARPVRPCGGSGPPVEDGQ
jgi:hypothetical protein